MRPTIRRESQAMVRQAPQTASIAGVALQEGAVAMVAPLPQTPETAALREVRAAVIGPRCPKCGGEMVARARCRSQHPLVPSRCWYHYCADTNCDGQVKAFRPDKA